MLGLELLQQVRFLLLVTSHATGLLLALIVHHLLDHGAGLPIQVTQARVLGCDFGNVDLGRSLHNMRPPFHLIHLIEVHIDFLPWGLGGCLKGPR